MVFFVKGKEKQGYMDHINRQLKGQDEDALIEHSNILEELLRCIWEDACSDYEENKGKCLVSSELIKKIPPLISDG